MKAYIMADGEGTRWNNWGGVPKQLIVINDETLLNRMCRLLKENGITDITIVGPFENEFAKNIRFENCKDKIDLWTRVAKESKEPFFILDGDIYYTDEIIKDAATRETNSFLHWLCPHMNHYTGKPWEEGYLFKVVDVDNWINKLTKLQEEINKGNIQLKSGWVIKNYLCDRPDLYKFYTELCEHDVYWHDQTDDFDFSNGPDCYSGFTNDYLRFIHNTGYKGGL